jgi:hypothetical protein
MVKTEFLEAILKLQKTLKSEETANEINKKMIYLQAESEKEIRLFDPSEEQLKQAYNL